MNWNPRRRLRRYIYLRALSFRYHQLIWNSADKKGPRYRRLIRTSNRLGWLLNGKSPWFDESAIHGNSMRNKPQLSMRERAEIDASNAKALQSWGIKMDPESRLQRRIEMQREQESSNERYSRYIQRGPLLIRLVRWLESKGITI